LQRADQRFPLSSLRTVRNRIPSKLTLRLAGSAVAIAAFASGATATALAGPAGPAVAPRAAHVPAGPVGAAGQPAASAASFTSPAAASGGHIVLLATSRTPRQIARAMLPQFNWSAAVQFKYLSWLWQRESGWNKYASNPYSGAYGIPQALPGSKMASAGPNWRANASTQIRWGLRYIRARYGSPHRAWNHSQATGWY
jgi:hypothetical protein